MFCRLALLSALVCVSVAQADQQVRHLVLNNANLVETQQGYAISAPSLVQINWKTVSVNGDNVEILAPNCQSTTLGKQDLLNMADQQNLLNQARQALYASENGYQIANQRSASTRYSLDSSSVSSSRTRNMAVSNISNNGVSITRFDEQNMSIAKRAGSLPNNINRVFMIDDVVAFVYQDGRVQMKPAACLSADEQQLVQQLRMEIQSSIRQSQLDAQNLQRNMQNMQQNMQRNMQSMQQNIQQSMQQNMQNMHQRLGGMFQQGFPFHNQVQQFNPMQTNRPLPGLGAGLPMGYGGPGAAATAAAAAGVNWPFGQNNNPFPPGFPFV